MAPKQRAKIWIDGSGGIHRSSTGTVYSVLHDADFSNSVFWYHVSMGQVGFRTTALSVHKYRLT